MKSLISGFIVGTIVCACGFTISNPRFWVLVITFGVLRVLQKNNIL